MPITFNPDLIWWIDFIITIVLYVVAIFIFGKILNKKKVALFCGALLVLNTVANILNLSLTTELVNIIAVAVVVIYGSIYSQEIRRRFIATRQGGSKNNKVKLTDEDTVNKIGEAVLALSSSRTGALITFEKNDNLNHYIESGSQIGAPISVDLIKTIFYEGTALHDGAIIIRGNTIVAASVYFTPSVKPLVGKYGSRHRAALGISEVCDAVTVVVSEETGRISFSKNGELLPCSRDNFVAQLKEYLSE